MSRWTLNDLPSQSGRIAIVTGTGGLGFEDALALTQAGGEVIIAGRNPDKGARAVMAIRQKSPDARIRFEILDLASLASVTAFAGRMAGDLGRPKVAAVTEDGEEIAPHGVGELRIGPGWRSKVSRIARPVLGGLENIEQMAFGHPVADFPLEGCQPVRGGGRRLPFQMQYAVGIQGQFGVPWEALIHRVGGLRELSLDEGDKVIARSGIPSPAQ